MQNPTSTFTEYNRKSEFSKPLLVHEQVKAVINARSNEMKGGYYNYTFNEGGNAIKTWIKDSRQVYVGHLISLIILITPEIYRDERAKEALETFENKKEKIFSTYAYPERIRVLDEGNKGKWKYTGLKYIPQIDESLPTENPDCPESEEYVLAKGLWNDKVNRYWDELVILSDIMFAEINLLIGSDTVKYFKPGSKFTGLGVG
jgi:hypothetical protein